MKRASNGLVFIREFDCAVCVGNVRINCLEIEFWKHGTSADCLFVVLGKLTSLSHWYAESYEGLDSQMLDPVYRLRRKTKRLFVFLSLRCWIFCELKLVLGCMCPGTERDTIYSSRI